MENYVVIAASVDGVSCRKLTREFLARELREWQDPKSYEAGPTFFDNADEFETRADCVGDDDYFVLIIPGKPLTLAEIQSITS